MLGCCAEHAIAPDIQLIEIEDANDAYRKVIDDDVRFRFVIDMRSPNKDA